MYGQIDQERSAQTDSTLRISIWALVLSLVGLVLYFRALNMPLYSDDYEWVIDTPASKLFYYFTHANPFTRFYRPIQMSTSALFQTFYGLNPLPNHLFQLGIHVTLCWLIYRWMRKLGWSRLQSELASVFMLIAQTNVLTVAGNDTSSELTSALFGYLSLWLFYRSYHYSAGPNEKWDGRRHALSYTGSLACFAACLFSKESGVSFLLAIGLVFLIMNAQDRRFRRALMDGLITVVPFVLVTVFYLSERGRVVTYPTAFGHETYNFHIGANIVTNLAQFWVSSLLPASTVNTFLDLKHQQIWSLALTLLQYLVFLGVVLVGLYISKAKRRQIWILATLMLIATFPVVLLNHVNEQYLYKAMPLVAALVGIGVGQLLTKLRPRVVSFGAVVLIFIGVAFSHQAAVIQKVSLMRQNGDRAQRLLPQILAYVPQVRPGGFLLLINDPKVDNYSEFLMSGFSLYEYGENIFNHLSGRTDFTARVLGSGDSDHFMLDKEFFDPMINADKDVALRLVGSTVIRYQPQKN